MGPGTDQRRSRAPVVALAPRTRPRRRRLPYGLSALISSHECCSAPPGRWEGWLVLPELPYPHGTFSLSRESTRACVNACVHADPASCARFFCLNSPFRLCILAAPHRPQPAKPTTCPLPHSASVHARVPDRPPSRRPSWGFEHCSRWHPCPLLWPFSCSPPSRCRHVPQHRAPCLADPQPPLPRPQLCTPTISFRVVVLSRAAPTRRFFGWRGVHPFSITCRSHHVHTSSAGDGRMRDSHDVDRRAPVLPERFVGIETHHHHTLPHELPLRCAQIAASFLSRRNEGRIPPVLPRIATYHQHARTLTMLCLAGSFTYALPGESFRRCSRGPPCSVPPIPPSSRELRDLRLEEESGDAGVGGVAGREPRGGVLELFPHAPEDGAGVFGHEGIAGVERGCGILSLIHI